MSTKSNVKKNQKNCQNKNKIKIEMAKNKHKNLNE